MSIAFDIIAYLGCFVVVHLLLGRLLKDPTNIDFWNSLLVCVVPSFLFYYGIPVAGSLISLNMAALFAFTVFLTWIVTGYVTVLEPAQDFLVSVVACVSYLLFYLGIHWAWIKAATMA